jgi:anti-anti-sigma factor
MFSIREHDDTGVTVIELGKRLTLENADELLRAAEKVFRAIAPRVVVSAKELISIDSSGIGALVTIKNRVLHTHGQFAVVGLRPDIKRMFTLMNLHQVIEIFETEDLATKVMGSRRV